MNILFVQTNTNTYLRPFPVGPALVAARLRGDGHELRFVDLMGEKHPARIAADAARESRPELVCFSIRNRDNQMMQRYDDPLPGVRDTIAAVREATEAPFLLGGTAFSTYPARILGYMSAAYGIAGDDLDNVSRFVRSMERGAPDLETPGLAFRDASGRVTCNPFAIAGYPRIDPAYNDFVERSRYKRCYWDAAVITRTGCPKRCIYCDTYVTFGRDFVLREPDDVLDELLALKRGGARAVWFVDAGFNRPLDHAKTLLREIIRRGAQLRYYALFDPGQADDEFFSLYKRAGGVGFTMFAESLSDPILAGLGKSFTFADVARDAAALRRHDIGFMFMPVLGAPGETRATVRETFDRTPALGAIMSSFGIGWRLQPGTELRERAVREGVIRADDDCWEPTFYLSPETPLDWLKRQRRAFMLRHPLLNARAVPYFMRQAFRKPWTWGPDSAVS
jgi:radical SAM superfamily enzyme YgiQ (UPF0313 family)